MAPEQCFMSRFQSLDNLEYRTGDLTAPWADFKVDITDMPFKDEYFDVVLCNHVLEHIDDDGAAMGELFRVLKADGWAILQVPIDSDRAETFEDPTIVGRKERLLAYGQEDHVRLYGRDYGTKHA
jgi:SAM-dependent methyltransferase